MRHSTARRWTQLTALLVLAAAAHAARAQVPSPSLVPQGTAPAPSAPAVPAPPKPKGPTTIEAQSVEGVSELEVTARGRVEFQREDMSIYSEFLRFNQEFGRIEADGGVRMVKGSNRYFGSRLRYNTQDDTGVFEDSNYLLEGDSSVMRGKAERLEFLGKDRFRLVRGAFSTCEPGHEDWRFEARELEIDNEKKEGTVRDGRLKFFDTTVLPLPYGSFSLENQRKSGFLAPYYSQNTRRGLEVAVPYYWNIAPEQDLTLIPSVMTKRGEQLKTQYRFMGQTYVGEMRYEYMPQDSELHRSRSAFSLQHRQQVTPNLLANVDLNKVSDARYFVDFSSQVRQVSTGNLQQMASLGYSGAVGSVPYYLGGMVQRWQTLQDPLAPITPPYARVPQLNFGTSKADIGGLADGFLNGEWVRFQHPTLVEGTRFSLNPSIAAPLLAPGYFFTPKVGVKYSSYSLTNAAAGQPDKQSVSVPWMSLDGGLVFERNGGWFGESVTQTLEPRFFYVYAPFRNQSQVPLFDTGIPAFSYAQLFTENRFAGGDRFGDANQITLAATSRILTQGGVEVLRATIGQRYYFADERVALNATTPLRTAGQSDFLASLGGRLAQALTFDSTAEYNPQQSRIERFGASARYAPEIAKVISASYRYNRDPTQPIRQVDLSGQWPVKPGWYAIGRVNYSFLDKRLLEGLGGVEYNAGCWTFRGAFQRLQAAAQTTSTGIYFQLEFNGFGGLGSDEILTMLRRSVPGYMVTNPTDSRLAPPSLRPRLPFEQVY